MKKVIAAILTAVLLLFCTACQTEKAAKEGGAAVFLPVESGQPERLAEETPAPSSDAIPFPQGGEPINRFDLQFTLDDASHTLVVQEKLKYYNGTGNGLTELYFNLYPNAFQTDGGGIELKTFEIEGEASELAQADGTVWKTELPEELPAGETVGIQMEYIVCIPNINNRFGYQDEVYNLGNCVITPAVYGENGWTVEPYVDLGDAFYTDIADYTAEIEVPDGYMIAAGGTETQPGIFEARNVRDFVFCAGKAYEQRSAEVQGTEIHVFCDKELPETGEFLLDAACKALTLYNELLGRYPYDTLTVVSSGLTGGVSGTEYPTLIMVAPEVPLEQFEMGISGSDGPGREYYEAQLAVTVAHEVAYQWFYGIVGNDQIQDPWLDEGFCRFAEYFYEQEYLPEEIEGFYWKRERFKDTDVMQRGGNENTISDQTKIGGSLYDWLNEPAEYSSGVYDTPAAMLYQMMLQMGGEQFLNALKEYVAVFAWDFVSPGDFRAFWNGKEDFSELFALYMGEA